MQSRTNILARHVFMGFSDFYGVVVAARHDHVKQEWIKFKIK